MDESLDDFFNLDEFAEEAKYTRLIYAHPSSKTQKISGIPGFGYVDNAKVHGYHTTFLTKSVNCPNIAEGDFLQMDSIEYTVADWEYDITKQLINLVLQTV